MADVLEFKAKIPIEIRIKQAYDSLAHFYGIGEAKSCSILYSTNKVTIRTPHNMWNFSLDDWKGFP